MRHSHFAAGCLSVALLALTIDSGAAQDTVKIGLVMPLTGILAAPGREVVDAVKLYIAQHGDTVAGKKIQLIEREDGNVAKQGRSMPS